MLSFTIVDEMPQFKVSITDDCRVANYNCNSFITRAAAYSAAIVITILKIEN
jgi:hypothetical protein